VPLWEQGLAQGQGPSISSFMSDKAMMNWLPAESGLPKRRIEMTPRSIGSLPNSGSSFTLESPSLRQPGGPPLPKRSRMALPLSSLEARELLDTNPSGPYQLPSVHVLAIWSL